MAAQRTLLSLRDELLDRCNFASMAVTDPATKRIMDSFIRQSQAHLYWHYEWDYLVRLFNMPLLAATTLYAFPVSGLDTLEPRRLRNVALWTNPPGGPYAFVREVREGITSEMRGTGGANLTSRYTVRDQIEIWPLPAAPTGYKLVIEGYVQLRDIVADTDLTTIDAELVLALALGKAKAHFSQPDAAVYAQETKDLLNRLRGYQHAGRRYISQPSDYVQGGVSPVPMPREV